MILKMSGIYEIKYMNTLYLCSKSLVRLLVRETVSGCHAGNVAISAQSDQ